MVRSATSASRRSLVAGGTGATRVLMRRCPSDISCGHPWMPPSGGSPPYCTEMQGKVRLGNCVRTKFRQGIDYLKSTVAAAPRETPRCAGVRKNTSLRALRVVKKNDHLGIQTKKKKKTARPSSFHRNKRLQRSLQCCDAKGHLINALRSTISWAP